MKLVVTAPAPAGLPWQSAGAVALVVLLALGCGGDAAQQKEDQGPRVLELDSSRIELPDSVRMAVITLDHSIAADLSPAAVTLRVDDIVRFEAKDAAGHALAFEGTGITEDVRAFLESTGQMRSPPLVSAGNAWVVSFSGAPAGSYPFTCVTHGGRGTITVTAR